MPFIPTVLQLFKYIGDALSLDLDKIYILNSNIYWKIYQVFLSVTGFLIFTRLSHRFIIKIPYFRMLIFIFGDLLYISTLSTLLNIYLCYQSSTKPFLYYDCYTNCWESVHICYIIINTIILFFYSSMIVLEKPKWNIGYIDEQHLFMIPQQTFIRTFMQSFLVSLKKFLWLIGSENYCIILILVFSCYLVFSIKVKPYNIEIINLWYCISYAAIIFVGIVSLMSISLNSEGSSIWLVIVLICWSCLTIFGIVAQKHKKYNWPFITDKVNLTLLRFAFQRASIIEVKKSVDNSNDFTFRPSAMDSKINP